MPLRVVYFGTYDRGPGRNAILMAGLAAAGVDVAECHVPLWRDTAAKLDAVRRGPAAAGMAARQALAWWRLARAHGRIGPYDVLIVGPTAHFDVPLARRLAGRLGRPVVFDPLVSLGETIRDRGLLAPGLPAAEAVDRAERSVFQLPDLCLADTEVHGAAFEAWFGPLRSAPRVIPVGAPDVYRRLPSTYRPKAGPPALRVVYAGQYIPLHGLDTILRAAARLGAGAGIELDLVGVGQTLAQARELARALRLGGHVRFHTAWLSPEALITEHLDPADVCLGIFGTQPKAARVVPYKVYAALAAGRAVVTADTPAVRELLGPGREVWTVPPGDPGALAAALARLAAEPDAREALARAGQAAWDRRFAPNVLGSRLAALLERLVAEHVRG